MMVDLRGQKRRNTNKVNRCLSPDTSQLGDSLDNFLQGRVDPDKDDVAGTKAPKPTFKQDLGEGGGGGGGGGLAIRPSEKDRAHGVVKSAQKEKREQFQEAQRQQRQAQERAEREQLKRIQLQRRAKLKQMGGGLDGGSWHGPPPAMKKTTTAARRHRSRSRDRRGPLQQQRPSSQSGYPGRILSNSSAESSPNNTKNDSTMDLLNLSQRLYGRSFMDDTTDAEDNESDDVKESDSSKENEKVQKKQTTHSQFDPGKRSGSTSRQRRSSSRDRSQDRSRALSSSRHGPSNGVGGRSTSRDARRSGRRSDSRNQRRSRSKSRTKGSGERDRSRSSSRGKSMQSSSHDRSSGVRKYAGRRGRSQDRQKTSQNGETTNTDTQQVSPKRRMRKGEAASLSAAKSSQTAGIAGTATVASEPAGSRSHNSVGKHLPTRSSHTRSSSRDKNRTRSSQRRSSSRDKAPRKAKSTGISDLKRTENELLSFIQSEHIASVPLSTPQRSTSLDIKSDHVTANISSPSSPDDGRSSSHHRRKGNRPNNNTKKVFSPKLKSWDDKRAAFRANMTDTEFKPTSILDFNDIDDWGDAVRKKKNRRAPVKQSSKDGASATFVEDNVDDVNKQEYTDNFPLPITTMMMKPPDNIRRMAGNKISTSLSVSCHTAGRFGSNGDANKRRLLSPKAAANKPTSFKI